ncbi:hypothetical protein ONS95_008405 [Cadophora gregata]|uniref:uncharacterized protein n=1 Tax=Cadophora gregata TaxID=51156 RepID=UPI0026DAA18B|nr:uncharacterized protein ONS95_008405 [Cadophora gregata]KAK0100455.1 hypothetical protein ONS96_007731 [Cadophora gregata f. sp. sojae]KAK0126826.1 hypothetical protein ONS95_008405 [Cadophora gregata]
MPSLLSLRKLFLFSLVHSTAFGRVHLKVRQDVQGGVVGSIPLCVVTAEGTLFTATSGVLPTDGCPSATNAATQLPSFITIAASVSGSSETFSQTTFPDLATLTVAQTVTIGVAKVDASGATSTILAPIIVGPGGIGFVGLTGALPIDVRIDIDGNTPGAPITDTSGRNNPGEAPPVGSPPVDSPPGDSPPVGSPPGDSPPVGPPPGGDSNSDKNNGDDNEDSDDSDEHNSSTTSPTSTQECILTEIACTQTCTISSNADAPTPTTICGDVGLCRSQAVDGQCTSTTGTITSTSYTTASISEFICRAGSCPGTVCGISSPKSAQAVATNAPGDKIPSLANLSDGVSRRALSRITRIDKIIKRVLDPEDPTTIRQLDFTDPNSLYPNNPRPHVYPPKDQWYVNAAKLVQVEGPGNLISAIGNNRQEGDASSTKFDYADLRQHAITTGSGPSSGCTSVLAFSERGVWIAHFWEMEQMLDLDFEGKVLQFIRKGDPGKFEGLSDVIPSLFSGPSPGEEDGEIVEIPIFSGAIIFTPSYRRPEETRRQHERENQRGSI